MSRPLRVLIVEDSVDDTFFIVRELQRDGFHVDFERVETAADMQAALARQGWDLIISDYRMPQFDGEACLAVFKQSEEDIPFIVVTGDLGDERAVQILKAGAHDYVMKDNLSRLVPAVKRELQAAQERRARRQAEASAAYLASIVQSCEDAIIGKTLDGTIVTWNPGAERLYGYSAIEVIGRSISMIFPPELKGELSRILREIRKGGHIEGLETVRVRKDGSPLEVSLTVSPIRDSLGRIVGVSTVARELGCRDRQTHERPARQQNAPTPSKR
jgi:PAS domain S-box-containing protein